jgi:hypothetical protein
MTRNKLLKPLQQDLDETSRRAQVESLSQVAARNALRLAAHLPILHSPHPQTGQGSSMC